MNSALGRAVVVRGDARHLPLPDASIDAIVTDPPYGLEFMGKDWDSFKPSGARIRTRVDGRTNPAEGKSTVSTPEAYVAGVPFQSWCTDWAREAYRVLKPGGHLVAFGGTRTWHRMVCAVEDAGFEIRDTLQWLYGCLTADAEILTETGWKLGIEVEAGERVAQWDHRTGQVTLTPVLEAFRAPWDGPMRVLRNADTDQVLTPNHRVYHQPRQRRMVAGVRSSWYESDWRVSEAGSLSTWDALRLPIAGEHEGQGIGGEDYAALLGWVWTEGGFDLSGTGVRIYQSDVNAEKVAEIAALMDRLGPHKRYDQRRTYTRRNGEAHPHVAVTWFFSGDLANRVRDDLPGKRPTYELLWRMTTAEKRALLRAAMLGDGSGWGTRSQQFYQQHEDDLVWLQTLLTLVGQSGKVGMRPNRPGGAVYLRNRATTELQARHLRDTWQDYTGEVWCVRVPTGAFVARRNGKVFVTGNSGFPKSLDVSKAIDKAAGAEREVICASPFASRKPNGTWTGEVYGEEPAHRAGPNITAPTTPEAVAWVGWGTALKPGHEPIVLARKPLAGTVAANVLAHGTGALNIDGCRVPAAPGDYDHPGNDNRAQTSMYNRFEREGRQAAPHNAGRWPTNVVLSHAPLLDEDGQPDGDACADGCVPGCPVAELDAPTAGLKAAVTVRRNLHGQEQCANGIYGSRRRAAPEDVSYGDSAGASRFYPTFRYEAKAPGSERPTVDGVAHPTVKPVPLMAWLVRLITPPGGTVLDMFAGTGPTGEAARHEGFNAVLIEKDPIHLPLIRRRFDQAQVRNLKPVKPPVKPAAGQADLFADGEAS